MASLWSLGPGYWLWRFASFERRHRYGFCCLDSCHFLAIYMYAEEISTREYLFYANFKTVAGGLSSIYGTSWLAHVDWDVATIYIYSNRIYMVEWNSYGRLDFIDSIGGLLHMNGNNSLTAVSWNIATIAIYMLGQIITPYGALWGYSHFNSSTSYGGIHATACHQYSMSPSLATATISIYIVSRIIYIYIFPSYGYYSDNVAMGGMYHLGNGSLNGTSNTLATSGNNIYSVTYRR